MLLYIANLPFDIRIARIRKLISDECRIDDVILDNLVNDNCGKRITVGLVDQEQASLVMAKINGYFIDGRKLQVEVVQKKIPNPQPLIKPFEQVAQPLLNNYNTMFPQPVNPVNANMNTYNAMPYYMAQQVSFLNTERQPAPQAIPFPSFNKQNPSSWYAMNFGSHQYGVSIAENPQSVQKVGIDLNAQKRSYDFESSGNPEKRQRGNADESFRSLEHGTAINNNDPRLRSRSLQSRDHDRDDRSRNDDRHDRYDDRYNSREDSHNSRDDRHNSRDDRYNSRDDRHNNRDDRHHSRDDRGNSRDERRNSHDERRNSRNDRYDRRDDHNDNSRRHYDSDSFSNFDSERSTFDNSNRNDNRRIVWEQSPNKQVQRSFNAANTAPKPLFPHLANINNSGPQNKPQENFNNPRHSFNNPQPIFNKLLQISNKPQQLVNNQQSFNKPQSSNNAQQNYNNQQNLNKPQTSNKAQQNFNKNQQNFNKSQQNFNKNQQKINNPHLKRPLSRKESRAVQFSVLTEIHSDLANKCDASQLALVKLKRLVLDRVKQIMEQHSCASAREIKEHYSRKYSIQDDREVKNIIRDNPNVEQAVSKNTAPQNIPQRQSRVPQASATSHPAPKAKITKVSKPGLAAGMVPALQTVPTEQKLPKYPNADKNVYRELKKKEQLEAQENFMYEVAQKYHVAIDYEMQKMRELAVNACKEGNNENTEKVRQEILKNGIDKVLKAMKQQVSKRLVNNFVGSVRIYFRYKPPKKPELEKFLKDYKVVSLKKSERSKFFVATCNTSDGYDSLLALGSATIDGVEVSIKPLNVLGKPDKKEKLTKYQENVSNMAQKFKLKTKQQPIQTNQNKQLDESFSDVEIVDSKMDEVVEIKDDWDFSDDIIEIKDTQESDTNIQQVSKQDTENIPLAKPESENTEISKQDTVNIPLAKPESDNTQISKQDTENIPLAKPESESTQISKQESVNSTQESENKLCIAQESGVTSNDELKSETISAIDDEDLEDF